jgi:hypothetical protein
VPNTTKEEYAWVIPPGQEERLIAVTQIYSPSPPFRSILCVTPAIKIEVNDDRHHSLFIDRHTGEMS